MFNTIHDLISEKKYDTATTALESFLNGDNKKESAYAGYLLGYINTCRDNPERKDYLARRYLRENLQGDFPHPYAYVLYSRLMDDPNVALNHLNKGLARFPTDVRILEELLSTSPDKNSIIAILEYRGIDNPWVLGHAITHLISTNQWDRIRYFISEIRKRHDNQPEDLLHLDLIEAYSFLFGSKPEYETAVKILERAIMADTDNRLAYSHYLGVIYGEIALGNTAKATTYFDRIPVSNSIMDFDDGPQSWDIEFNFEDSYKKIFDSLALAFAADSRRKAKASALYALYLHYPSDISGIYRYKKSDAASLARYLKIEFNKAVASALYDMRCHFNQAKEAYDVLWFFLKEYENPENNSVFFSEILNYADGETVSQLVSQTDKYLTEYDCDHDCFVQCVFSELIDKLHKFGWYDKVRMLAKHLSNETIFKSSCLFECAYAYGDIEDDRATALYEELVKREPDNSSGMNNLGVCYLRAGYSYKALDCYEKACTISPKEELYQKNLDNAKTRIDHQREVELSEVASSISIDTLEDIGYTTDLCRMIFRIKDSEMRGIIQRDLLECAIAVVAHQDKLATIMCGSIVEALIMQKIREQGILKYNISSISNHKKATNFPVSEMGLNELLFVADAEQILDKNSYHLGHYIRDYRNVVHPAKEIRMKENVSHDNVLTMWSVVKRLVVDLFQA